jgi:hypothetical protein
MSIFLLLSIIFAAKLKIVHGNAKKSGVKDYCVAIITIAGIYLRQERSKAECNRLLLLSSFCIGLILSLYEDCVTSELIVAAPKFEHNLSSLLMSAGSKVIYVAESQSPTNSEVQELMVESQKWNIPYSKDKFQSNNVLHRKGLPIENGMTLSYFGFYAATESDLALSKLRILNNKCYCYIVKHRFRQRGAYFIFELFLRSRFASIGNYLRESGIFSFFVQQHRKFIFKIGLAGLRRRLEEGKYHSDFFVREVPRIDSIGLQDLYFIFVILAGMGFLAVNIFALRQIDWRTLYAHSKNFVLKHLRAISSVNYVRILNRLCTFRLRRIILK